MTAIVFAGPSLSGVAVPADEGYDLAPPAKCGDVMRAVRAGRKVIGLIDGVFESVPAVWHKEILFALAAGCRVLGAASMGALRAAECQSFGMIGIGRIFEDYRSGRRTADADVALVHGPAEVNYLPVTVALVDVDDSIERMLAAGVIAPRFAETLSDLARQTHFKSRTWEGLLSGLGASRPVQSSLLRWIGKSGPGAKARDALALIERLIQMPPRGAARGEFMHTHFSARLLQRVED